MRKIVQLSARFPDAAEMKENDFPQQFIDFMTGAGAALMISIGHRTGLFDVLSDSPPVTSQELSRRSGLQERYVREWLGAVATAGIVDEEDGVYTLPPERAAFLTRKGAPNNLAVIAQYVPLLAKVEDDIIECFKAGGGVDYSHYPDFHRVMSEDSAQSVVAALEEHILPLVEGMADDLHSGVSLLDVGCGSGAALRKLATIFPKSVFTGYDFSQEAIERSRSGSKDLPNLTFEVRDLSSFDSEADPERFHYVTSFDAIHDQAKPLNVLKGIYRTLRTGGVYLMQEIRGSGSVAQDKENPLAPFLYTVSCMHCMTVSLAQGGEGLGAMWGERKARELLAAAGFREVEIRRLEHDIQNDYYIVRKR